jgi:N-methylhydantoinase B
MATAVFGALAKIAPERVFACESGGDTGISYGGYDAERKPFVFIEFLYGGWGGRPDRDGVDGCSSSVVNFSNNPIEIIEAEQALRIREYGYVPDTGGAGTFRGSLALVREWEFTADEATFQMRTDRRRFVPYGLAGGRDGTPSTNVLDPDGAAVELPTKTRLTVHSGDRVRHRVAGAGGWGDPLRREPARVLHDVREEKLTAAYAEREYGVVIDEARGVVDEERTAALRRRRSTRG